MFYSFYERGIELVRVVNVNISEKNKLNFMLNEKGFHCLLCRDRGEQDRFLQVLTRITDTRGDILLGNESILKCRDNIYRKKLNDLGIVYRDYKFIEYKNVFDNFKYYLEIRGCADGKVEELIEESLDFFGIKEKKISEIHSLTHDEKVVAGLARAMMTEPKYLILDDIHMNTGSEMWTKIFSFLKKVSKSGTGILYLTSDKEFGKNNKISMIEGAL